MSNIYYERLIDNELQKWKDSPRRKPLLIRGARQVGKSTAVRQFGKSFGNFVEINLEKEPSLKKIFAGDIDVHRICETLSGALAKPIVAGETLLFIDEIQESQEAIMTLRYFKEDYPELHVIAAASLLEFAISELPTFGVGRITSLYMYPFSFDEFLMSQGLKMNVDFKRRATSDSPLPDKLHTEMVRQLRTFYLVGGMPAAVAEWNKTHNYQSVSVVHHDILDSFQDDFAKYKSRTEPVLLRQVLRSVALQAGQKFVYSQIGNDTKTSTAKNALDVLSLAGLISPVTHSDGNGVPLGAEENNKFTKYLFFDLGLMLTLLDAPASATLLADEMDLVNKGASSEMFAGLEMQKYGNCFTKSDLHYWQNMTRNGNAEVDYLMLAEGTVVPMEVKANSRGNMQSLWLFMRKRNLQKAIRTSLENFASFDYSDSEADGILRHVNVVPLYALSNIMHHD